MPKNRPSLKMKARVLQRVAKVGSNRGQDVQKWSKSIILSKSIVLKSWGGYTLFLRWAKKYVIWSKINGLTEVRIRSKSRVLAKMEVRVHREVQNLWFPRSVNLRILGGGTPYFYVGIKMYRFVEFGHIL